MPEKTVDDLIRSAKKTSEFSLPPAALADLKKVLKANDRESNRLKRVPCDAFRAFLAEKHKIMIGKSAFDHYLRRELGRSWS